MEQQLVTIILEQQSYDKKYMIWIKRIESKRPRLVLLEYKWSEIRRVKMQYERENKENQPNNAIKQTGEN